jgi:hypothetical protein
LRGNVYTFDDIQTLSEIRMILGFTGSANLYYYVLEATTLNGQYTPIFEKAVVTTGTGSALYSSGAINVTLQPGYYYGIGVAWNAETITYYRNIIHLPRPWEMGTVGKSLQYNGNIPITGPISPSSFAGAEYAVDLCFGGGGLTTYDVYLGADESQMELVATDLEEPVFTPCILDYETTYYWQVVAKNDCGLAAGPIWSFTTQAWQPLPEDGAMEVPLDTMLRSRSPVPVRNFTLGTLWRTISPLKGPTTP